MRIATWNVNSIRARADRVEVFLNRSGVDVLAIQELKCKDAQFPRGPFDNAGFDVAFHGLNQWNGVAIASRVGLEDVELGFDHIPGWGDDDAVEARAISAVCNGVRVYSLYVPNGRELTHPHYRYKLTWLENLRRVVEARLANNAQDRFVLTGDFNVAPLDEDVWDMKAFEGATHVSQPERDAFQGLLDAGLSEVSREFTPGEYTFWDYQQLRFPKKEGMRIDFQLASPALAAQVTGASIDRDERKGKGASDHAPVIVDYAD